MHLYFYLRFIHLCWLIIGLYWLANARNTKPTVRRQNMVLRWTYLMALVLSLVLLYSPFYRISWLRTALLPQGDITGIAGCVLCAGGVAFAMWARYTLGQNWSGNVTIKEGHELIRSGPYSIVRHPIYTGALLAVIGSACVSGYMKGLLAVILCFISFWYKLRMEEDFMMEEFPDAYPAYRREVKMIIPFIF